MLRLDKSVMVLELKVHFPNYKNYILEFYILEKLYISLEKPD